MFTNVSIIIAANMNTAWPTFSLEIQSLKGFCGSKERADPKAALKPCSTPGLWKRPPHSVLSRARWWRLLYGARILLPSSSLLKTFGPNLWWYHDPNSTPRLEQHTMTQPLTLPPHQKTWNAPTCFLCCLLKKVLSWPSSMTPGASNSFLSPHCQLSQATVWKHKQPSILQNGDWLRWHWPQQCVAHK